MSKNFYDVLGVPKNAKDNEIKRAYRELSKKYHPDINPNNPEAEKKFKEINEAYATLGKPEKKEKYDLTIKIDSSRNEFNGSINNTNTSPICEDIFKNERLDYIKFLNENEERANLCGRTLKPLIEDAYSIPGLVIYEKKVQIQNELIQLERNCLAFDRYMEFLNKNEERANLCSKSLQEIKKKIINKRGILSQSEIFDFEREIERQLWHFEEERKNKIEILKAELMKKGLDFEAYLAERNLLENTISSNAILTAIKSMNLIDKINLQLLTVGITIEEFLTSRGKMLIQMRYKELVEIHEGINNLMQNNKLANINDIMAINLSENEGIKKRA